MGKRNRTPKKNRRPVHQRQRNDEADFWLDELEERLTVFGASSCDLPDLDGESC